MKTSSVFKPVCLMALVILALAQFACSYATQLIGESLQKSGTSQPASCVNKYLPANAGATRTLAGSGYTEIITIPSLRKANFEEKWIEGPTGGKQTTNYYLWDCTNAGLVLSGVNSRMFLANKGVTVPVSIKAGDHWTQSYQELISTITTNYVAVGEESITLPAGTFTAMKIQINSVAHANTGNKNPDLKEEGFEWWAEGIGTIKTAITYIGTTTTPQVVRELQSYSNP